jgi:hypothetical protein
MMMMMAMAMATATAKVRAKVAMMDAAMMATTMMAEKNFSDVRVQPIRNVDLNRPDAASTKADKERELMLLQA